MRHRRAGVLPWVKPCADQVTVRSLGRGEASGRRQTRPSHGPQAGPVDMMTHPSKPVHQGDVFASPTCAEAPPTIRSQAGRGDDLGARTGSANKSLYTQWCCGHPCNARSQVCRQPVGFGDVESLRRLRQRRRTPAIAGGAACSGQFQWPSVEFTRWEAHGVKATPCGIQPCNIAQTSSATTTPPGAGPQRHHLPYRVETRAVDRMR